MQEEKHVAILLKSLKAGGMQSSLLRLAAGLADRGVRVDVLVTGQADGALAEVVPSNVTLIPLKKSDGKAGRLTQWSNMRRAIRSFEKSSNSSEKTPVHFVQPKPARYLRSLTDYLAHKQPDGLIVAGTVYNLLALWARKLSGASTRIVVSERNSMISEIGLPRNKDKWHWKHAKKLVSSTYPNADAIVANSHGVARDVAECTGLPLDSITTIYNPIVNDTLKRKAKEDVDHPWFGEGKPPVVLGVGRMHPQKDFQTLVRAFARLRKHRDARLVIFGEILPKDRIRNDLLALAAELGVAEDVDLPGVTSNPYAYMSKAAVFVLSSRYEGCPNVLVEALACGCPVVSTRCPHGPDEILEDGRYGRLVDVGDHEEMARAISHTLDHPLSKEELQACASKFTFAPAVDGYLQCIWTEATAA